jgi:hypothetical protein
MNEHDWRQVTEAVGYSVDAESELGDGVVERVARRLVLRPLSGFTRDAEYAALGRAAEHPGPVLLLPGARHDDASLRKFMSRVRLRMDAMRPWPELPFEQLGSTAWHTFTTSIRPVARLHVYRMDVQDRLGRAFDRVPAEVAGAEDRSALLLRLASGDDVALVAWWWEGSDDVALLADPVSTRSNAELSAAFRAATGFAAAELTVLPAGQVDDGYVPGGIADRLERHDDVAHGEPGRGSPLRDI